MTDIPKNVFFAQATAKSVPPKADAAKPIIKDYMAATTKSKVDSFKPSPEVAQLREYVQKNQKSFYSVISNVFKAPLGKNSCQFVFVGESHDTGHKLADELIKDFKKLKKEVEDRGETLVLMIERPVSWQNTIENSKLESLKFLLGNESDDDYKSQGMTKVMLAAKEAGIRIVCVDPEIPGLPVGETPSITQFNKRDEDLLTNMTGAVNPKVKTRVLYYGGLVHGSTKPIANSATSTYTSVATHLTKKYGKDSVISFRNVVNNVIGFDGEAPAKSKFPSPKDILDPKKKEIVVIPTGNLNINKQGFHDYLILVP